MESGGIAPSFMALAIEGKEWSDSLLGNFTSREKFPCTHLIGLLGLRAGLDAVK
jgi:hypothetical protein